MTIAIFPGSFDPITKGHLDILEQASEVFERVIIAVAYNPDKKSFLPVEKRIMLIKECTKEINNVDVDSFNGLTVEYAKQKGITVLIRGLRGSKDFEYEMELAQINRTLNPGIKTVFFTPNAENCFISSSAVREILSNNGDISALVPENIIRLL